MTDGRRGEGDSSGYVHDPEAFRERETGAGTKNSAETGTENENGRNDHNDGGRPLTPRNDPRPGDASVTVPGRETFGLRGWALVCVVLVSFLVVPTLIVLVPPSALPFEVAFLVLPLLPALLLGAVAVWSALAGV